MKKLTDNNRKIALLTPILISVGGILLCTAILKDKVVFMILGILIFALIGYFYSRYRFNKSFELYYDDNYLYLKKVDQLKKIDLDNISKVKLMPSNVKIFGVSFNQYKIELKNQIHILEPIKFWVTFGVSNIWDFENHLKYHSPKTIVEHSYNIFDR